MTLLHIKIAGNSVLKKKALPIENITDKIKSLAVDMAETMKSAKGLGLAAPQVGKSIRLVVIDKGYLAFDALIEAGEEPPERPEFIPVPMINPEIISHEGEYVMEEGCLSVPGYRAEVERAEKIRYRYTDIDGNTVEEDAKDLAAVAIQHEIDHLNGILFIDRISRLKKKIALKKVKKFIDNLKENGSEAENRLYGDT